MGMATLISFLLVSCVGWANLLVLDYEPKDTNSHQQGVEEYMVCADSVIECETYRTDFFLDELQKKVHSKLSSFDIININFNIQNPLFKSSRPGPTLENLDFMLSNSKFEKRKENIEKLISENEKKLFVAAAGNGFRLKGERVISVPLTKNYEVVPASFESENLIKVTAVKEQGLGFENLEVKTLGKNVNYGLNLVDVAAVVGFEYSVGGLVSTKVAAARVAELASVIKKSHPRLSPQNIKTIIMKTSYVKNLERALELEKNLAVNQEHSLLGKLKVEKNYEKREKIRKKIGDVILVKSGGVVVPEVALLCADIYEQAFGLLSLEQSCLEAQKNKLYLNSFREEKLKELWSLRGY